jgi:16S rRNA (guanine966-N2)-methyltransferase
MRIVGGALRGRRFDAPKGKGTRPTSDRVREALASALESRGAFDGARVLDLFAGTGALSFEALSRGADHAVLAEKDGRVLAGLKKSAGALGLTDHVTIRREDLSKGGAVSRLNALGPFDLVFADPPYAELSLLGPLLAGLESALADGAWIAIERASRDALPDHPFVVDTTYRYGETSVDLLSPERAS